MPDFSLYVHIPFCSSKCHFCIWVVDVPTHQLTNSSELFPEYTEALIKQIEFYSEVTKRLGSSKSIYFGGGTPTALSARELERVLSCLVHKFRLSDNVEDVTIEASPETISFEKLSDLKRAGFDRISIGVQSFNNSRLRKLGRSHSRASAVRAVEDARHAGFENINIDLMFGLPDETSEEWEDTLMTGLLLEPEHLSLYVYTPIPGTVARRQLERRWSTAVPPSQTACRYLKASELLSDRGYNEYMFQLFERGDKKCNYDFSSFHLQLEYLGFGAGAHSLMGQRVFGHHADLGRYCSNPIKPSYNSQARTVENVLATKAYQMLHTEAGVLYESFQSKLGISFHQAKQEFVSVRKLYEDLSCKKLIEETKSGFRFKNQDSMARWFCDV